MLKRAVVWVNLITPILGGAAIGALNGLFGAGGGMVAVPLLSLCGLSRRESHATSIAVILPLTLLSIFLYIRAGTVDFYAAVPYLGGGVLGALAGSFLLGRISPTWLKRIFGGLILFAAVRMWLS